MDAVGQFTGRNGFSKVAHTGCPFGDIAWRGKRIIIPSDTLSILQQQAARRADVFLTFSIPAKAKTGGNMLSSKSGNEELVRAAFKNIIEADHVCETEVARFFSPDYIQHVDGHSLDYQGFIHHLHAQRKEIAHMRVSFLSVIGDEHDVFTNHIVSVCKKDGTEATIKVLAQFTIRNKKIIACDELTHMISGTADDKNLGSRR